MFDLTAGHNLLGALEIAYKYFENERISNTSRDRGIYKTNLCIYMYNYV